MRLTLLSRLASAALLTLSSFIPVTSPLKAADFQEQAIDQSLVVAVARPYGEGKFDLLVLEQIPGKKQCWGESGSNPALIDPMLLNFDFTGICRRATDSNGYSIRLDGQDLGLDYLLRVVPRNGELVLVGTARTGNYPEIIVGETNGLVGGFMKIQLNPGWQFTRRTYNGKALGHYYFSASRTVLESSPAAATTTVPATDETSQQVAAATFTDISQNPYKPEIEVAVKLGFVAGFEDGTFRPQEQVTREQMISMGVDAIATVYTVNLDAEPERSVIAFRDVPDSRWSAKKIKWAQWNFLTVGNPNNTLQPEEPITRAELIDIMRRIAIHLRQHYNLSEEFPQTQKPVEFSDTSKHWAETVISQMSGYCGVATPLNEQGTTFDPDAKVTRDYSAAALTRTITCVQSEAKATGNQSWLLEDEYEPIEGRLAASKKTT
jgi:hypothetical protein